MLSLKIINRIINHIVITKDDFESFNDTFYELLNKSKIFYKNAICGTIITKFTLKINSFPKLSVVIPIFSTEKTIRRAVISVQNQNFSDFVIILIDDFSKDNTLKIIEDLGRYVKRIILLFTFIFPFLINLTL